MVNFARRVGRTGTDRMLDSIAKKHLEDAGLSLVATCEIPFQVVITAWF